MVSVVAVKNPHLQKVQYFKALSLMFGETPAVYAFLRFSRAISALAASILSLVTVEFFDDFTQIEPRATGDSAMNSMESLLEILGWRVATSESKRLPFAEKFVSLGVTVDFSAAAHGCVILTHKPGRISGIKDQIEKLRQARMMKFKDALSIRGKLYFSEGQVYGRVAAPVVHMLSRCSEFVVSYFTSSDPPPGSIHTS